MKARLLLSLLYASIVGILFILSLVVGYTLSYESSVATGAVSLAATPVVNAPEDPAVKLGKAIWNSNNCSSCHAKNMKDDLTGPALSGVTARWAAYPREDLYAWIRNSSILIEARHPRAIEVWMENKKGVMANYPNLTDEERHPF